MFGGISGNSGLSVNHLYVLSLKTNTWLKLSPHFNRVRGIFPSPRDKFTLWNFKENIFLFGGYGPKPEMCLEGTFVEMIGPSEIVGWNNHLFGLKCNSDPYVWFQPKHKSPPSPRAAHACAVINEQCYIFGGRFQNKRLNDLYCFHNENFQWKTITPIGKLPIGRSWHSFDNLSENQLFLYGGFDTNANILMDAWIFNIDKNCWIEVSTKELGIFAPRMWHGACSTHNKGEIIIFGGSYSSLFAPDEKQTNAVSFFRSTPLPLEDICLQYIKENISTSISLQSINFLPTYLKDLIYPLKSNLKLQNLKDHI